jgi:phosphatidylserine decarboxylase
MNYVVLAPEFVALTASAWVLARRGARWCVLAALVTVAVLCFFRGASDIPSRFERDVLYSPCDGTVEEVVDHGAYVQVCVFLGVSNVHVQYCPCDAKVLSVRHIPGTFHPAYMLQKSTCNERVEYELATHFGAVRVVQIAGQLARRIVPFVRAGQRLPAMSPMGMIKLGSRCDIYFVGRTAAVKGTRVRVGDILARKLRAVS